LYKRKKNLANLTQKPEGQTVKESAALGLLENIQASFGLFDVISENDNVIDLRLIWANQTYLDIVNLPLEKAAGMLFSQIAPLDSNWIQFYGDIGLRKKEAQLIESYSHFANQYILVQAYSPSPGQVATVIHILNKFVQTELENMLNGIDAMIYATEIETGKVLFVNTNMKKAFNLNRDVKGEYCYKLFRKGADAMCPFCRCSQLEKEPDKFIVWEEYFPENDQYVRHTDSFIDWPDGGKVHLQHAVDITETVKAKKQAEQDSKNLQTLLDMLPVAVRILKYSDSSLIYSNKAALDMFKCKTIDDISGKTGYSFMPEMQPGGIKSEDMMRQMAESESIVQDFQCIKLTGEYFMARLTSKTINYRGERSSLAIMENITEQMEYHKMLEHTAFKEQEANQLKSRFLATMSHEIRTPMNAILGITEIQLQNEAHPPETEEAFLRIYNSSNLLLDLINEILDLSKIEADKLEIVPVQYDVPSLINDTVQLNYLLHESRRIDFKINVDPQTPLNLFGDVLRIKQILNNLLSNAVKYTDKGEVILSVSVESEKEDVVVIIFSVKDTGQGMTEEQLGRLFTEYTRFNLEANQTIIGAGLGLKITKSLAELMNGKISVESKKDKGSTFTVYLPQKRIGNAVCGSDFADKLRQFSFTDISKTKKTSFIREYMPYGSVLVVDDVESNLYVAKGLMQPYGLKIETAASGFEAIEKIKIGNVYDILFMDHMMPGMDGIEAVRIIRELSYTHPIVALTANAVKGQAEIFLKNGFDFYLSKPIDSRELNALLNKLIRDKQPARIIEETRHKKNKTPIVSEITPVNEELIKIFLRDAAKTIAILEILYPKLGAGTLEDEEMQSFTVCVHGIKTALANIGETELSKDALALEQASRKRDTGIMSKETEPFLSALKNLAAKLKSSGDGLEETDSIDTSINVSMEDYEYLQDKMHAIKNACESYNKSAVKKTLSELKQKQWPRQVKNNLENIAEYLLHSEFEKIMTIVDNINNFP
jgi:signal transduction histidine kinase/DNA-binding NarL/FixJ family response regulator/HPt (histidine-containing phosphotransfer) domain-containing protein